MAFLNIGSNIERWRPHRRRHMVMVRVMVMVMVMVMTMAMGMETHTYFSRQVWKLRSEQLQTTELIMRQHDIVEAEMCVLLFSWQRLWIVGNNIWKYWYGHDRYNSSRIFKSQSLLSCFLCLYSVVLIINSTHGTDCQLNDFRIDICLHGYLVLISGVVPTKWN